MAVLGQGATRDDVPLDDRAQLVALLARRMALQDEARRRAERRKAAKRWLVDGHRGAVAVRRATRDDGRLHDALLLAERQRRHALWRLARVTHPGTDHDELVRRFDAMWSEALFPQVLARCLAEIDEADNRHEVLSLQEAADVLGVHYDTLVEQVRAGGLRAVVANGRHWIHRHDLDAYIDRCRVPPRRRAKRPSPAGDPKR